MRKAAGRSGGFFLVGLSFKLVRSILTYVLFFIRFIDIIQKKMPNPAAAGPRTGRTWTLRVTIHATCTEYRVDNQR